MASSNNSGKDSAAPHGSSFASPRGSSSAAPHKTVKLYDNKASSSSSSGWFPSRACYAALLLAQPAIPAAAELPTWKRTVIFTDARPVFTVPFRSVAGVAPASVLTALTRATGFAALLKFVTNNGLEYAWFDEPTAVLTYEPGSGQFALYAPTVWEARVERRADAGDSKAPAVVLDVSNETLFNRAFDACDRPCVSIDMPVPALDALGVDDPIAAFDACATWLDVTCGQVAYISPDRTHIRLKGIASARFLLHFLSELHEDTVFTSAAGFVVLDFRRGRIHLMSREYYFRVCHPKVVTGLVVSESATAGSNIVAMSIGLSQAQLLAAREMKANPVVTPKRPTTGDSSAAPMLQRRAAERAAAAAAAAAEEGAASASAAPPPAPVKPVAKKARFGPGPGWTAGQAEAWNQQQEREETAAAFGLVLSSRTRCDACHGALASVADGPLCDPCRRYRAAVAADLETVARILQRSDLKRKASEVEAEAEESAFGGFAPWEEAAPAEQTPSVLGLSEGLLPRCTVPGCSDLAVDGTTLCSACADAEKQQQQQQEQQQQEQQQKSSKPAEVPDVEIAGVVDPAVTTFSRAFYAAHYAATVLRVIDLEAVATAPGGVTDPSRWRFGPGALVRVIDRRGGRSSLPWQVRARALDDDGYPIYILTEAPDVPERAGRLTARPLFFHEVLETAVKAWHE